MSDSKSKSLPRRDFLKATGITGAVAGVAAVALNEKPAKAAEMKTSGHAGYRETEQIKTYYELARF